MRRLIDWDITGPACVGLALSVVVLPIRWLLAMAFAAAVHELAHLLVLTLFRVPIFGIRIGLGGAQIRTGPLEPGTEVLCALAGPLGSGIVVLLARWLPLAALIAAAQGLCNLLPLENMDGGRAVRALLDALAPGHRVRVMQWLSLAVKGSVILLCLWAGYRLRLGLMPFFAAVFWAFGKNPCNDGPERVQ